MTLVSTHTAKAREVLQARYADLTLIHEGRNGLVFTGHGADAATPMVALKVAYPDSGAVDLSSARVRFRREAEIGARLSHPHILRSTPVETLDGLEFYEMDRAGPIRLDGLITAPRPPGFDRAVEIVQQIAAALDYAHAHGIVHGALCPSNVLLDESGRVLLKGFLLYAHGDVAHPALEPGVVGDPAYMAPEQRHDSSADRRLDVYSLGVLAYELFTGRARVGYDQAGIPEIRPIELAPNHALRPDVPLHVTAAIQRALNKDPAVRFATAGQFAYALTHANAAQGQSLPTYSPPVRRQRHALWILVLLLVIVAVTIVLVVPSPLRDLLVPPLGSAVRSFR